MAGPENLLPAPQQAYQLAEIQQKLEALVFAQIQLGQQSGLTMPQDQCQEKPRFDWMEAFAAECPVLVGLSQELVAKPTVPT